MKNLLLLPLILSLFAGCATAPTRPTEQNTIRRINNLSYLLTVAFVNNKPERKNIAGEIYTALKSFQSGGAFDPSVFNKITVKNKELYEAVIFIVLDELDAAGIKMNTPEQVKVYLQPILDGMGRALVSN